MQTAGRTVAFSAGTVAISLASLAIFLVPYLRSFAYAGVTVVLLAAGAAIVVLPAVLAVLNHPELFGWLGAKVLAVIVLGTLTVMAVTSVVVDLVLRLTHHQAAA